jgi:N-acetylneuraminic acid mutarotase
MKIFNRYLLLGLFLISMVSFLSNCGGNDPEDLIGNWIKQSDFFGDARGDAVAFTIGNYAYVGTGYDGEDRRSDFFQYDAERNNWKQVADFGGKPRQGAVAFAAAGKGYVGTGWDGLKKYSDFWIYDPIDNTWDTLAAEFEGAERIEPRYAAVAFSIEDIGYIGTGFSGNALMDLWAYNPATNTWSPKTNYQSKVYDAVAFAINGKGYICTGWNNNTYSKDFFSYDPGTDSWTALRKIGNVSDESYDDGYTIIRKKGVAFVIDGKAYVATGDMGNQKNDVWEYTPSTDLWTTRTNFEGATRVDAVAFSTADGRGFVTTGLSSSTPFDDIWEFKPLDTYNEED